MSYTQSLIVVYSVCTRLVSPGQHSIPGFERGSALMLPWLPQTDKSFRNGKCEWHKWIMDENVHACTSVCSINSNAVHTVLHNAYACAHILCVHGHTQVYDHVN